MVRVRVEAGPRYSVPRNPNIPEQQLEDVICSKILDIGGLQLVFPCTAWRDIGAPPHSRGCVGWKISHEAGLLFLPNQEPPTGEEAAKHAASDGLDTALPGVPEVISLILGAGMAGPWLERAKRDSPDANIKLYHRMLKDKDSFYLPYVEIVEASECHTSSFFQSRRTFLTLVRETVAGDRSTVVLRSLGDEGPPAAFYLNNLRLEAEIKQLVAIARLNMLTPSFYDDFEKHFVSPFGENWREHREEIWDGLHKAITAQLRRLDVGPEGFGDSTSPKLAAAALQLLAPTLPAFVQLSPDNHHIEVLEARAQNKPWPPAAAPKRASAFDVNAKSRVATSGGAS